MYTVQEYVVEAQIDDGFENNDDGGFEDAAADDGDDGSHDALLLVFSGAHSAMSS